MPKLGIDFSTILDFIPEGTPVAVRLKVCRAHGERGTFCPEASVSPDGTETVTLACSVVAPARLQGAPTFFHRLTVFIPEGGKNEWRVKATDRFLSSVLLYCDDALVDVPPFANLDGLVVVCTTKVWLNKFGEEQNDIGKILSPRLNVAVDLLREARRG